MDALHEVFGESVIKSRILLPRSLNFCDFVKQAERKVCETSHFSKEHLTFDTLADRLRRVWKYIRAM
jgi:hypothetical protein